MHTGTVYTKLHVNKHAMILRKFGNCTETIITYGGIFNRIFRYREKLLRPISFRVQCLGYFLLPKFKGIGNDMASA